MKISKADKLDVKIFNSRDEMGRAAAIEVSGVIHKLLQQKSVINMIFAAAPSQNEFFKYLIQDKSVEWHRIRAFHMDEYVGLDENAPQRFGNFLRRSLFDKVPFAEVFYINGTCESPEAEAEHYAAILKQFPADIVCLGIGENTHLAFNDPHEADFADPLPVKVVELDKVCRQQQVNDGCFQSLEEVPVHAITLTIPTLYSGNYLFCIVPGRNKTWAVEKTLKEEISEKYPSTILRKHERAVLFLDKESSPL